MKNLSKKQQEIVDKMKQGAYIDRTFYGRSVAAYLCFSGLREKETISNATVDSLRSNGVIAIDEKASTYGGITHHIFRLKQ